MMATASPSPLHTYARPNFPCGKCTRSRTTRPTRLKSWLRLPATATAACASSPTNSNAQRKRTHLIPRLALVTLCAFTTWTSLRDSTHAADVQVFFSPRGGTARAICDRIDQAATSVDVAAFQLSRTDIATALWQAKERGVLVRVIIDGKQEAAGAPTPTRLRGHGVAVGADHLEKINHNKYIVIDSNVTITGSFNFSDNAELRNAENTVIITDRDVAAAFTTNFLAHWSHCQPFIPDRPKPKPRR